MDASPCQHSPLKSLADISAQRRPQKGLPPLPWARKRLQRGSPWLQRRNSPRPRQLDDTPLAPSRNSRSSVLRSSAGGCLSSRLLEREIPHPRALAKGLRRNLREQAQRAQRVRASLCRACWGRQLLVSAELRLAHGLELYLGGGAHTGGLKGQPLGQTAATLAGTRSAQAAPLDDGASFGSTLLRIASALEQKQDSAGTVQDDFGLNPAIASSQEEYEAFCGDRSSREAFGAGRLGRQALVARVVRTRKERPEVVIAAHDDRVRRDPQRPRGRTMVLAQTRRRVLGACFHCVATSAASEGSSP